MTGYTHIHRFITILLAAAALLAGGGCASSGSKERAFEPFVRPELGRVVRINPADGYVILECTALPSEGERITLYRNERKAAEVRVGRVRDGRYIAADIVEGTPMIGDRFRRDKNDNATQPRL